MAKDMVGREIDGWRLIEKLGKEALGEVYVAKDAAGTEARFKILGSDAANHRRRFAREIEATRAIVHPNVLRLIADGDVDGRPYMAFEHVEGETVDWMLKIKRQLAVEEALDVTRQVLRGLSAAHARGVVHRNLCAHNVLVTTLSGRGAPRVVIRDFGLARLEFGSEDDRPLTATNVRVGNISYMAPEYLENGQVGPASDLFAVGILLYETLVGQPPPLGTYPAGRPSLHRPEIPAWVDDVVQRLTQAEPSERPASAEQVLERLEGTATVTAAPDGRGRLALFGVIAASALVAAALLVTLIAVGAAWLLLVW